MRWESSNPEIATIDDAGIVTAVSPGNTTIKCFVLGKEIIVECEVTDCLILGDANGDGVVSVLDATTIQRYMAKLSVPNAERVELCGDVNGDGLNILDATAIQRYLSKLSAPEGIGQSNF